MWAMDRALDSRNKRSRDWNGEAISNRGWPDDHEPALFDTEGSWLDIWTNIIDSDGLHFNGDNIYSQYDIGQDIESCLQTSLNTSQHTTITPSSSDSFRVQTNTEDAASSEIVCFGTLHEVQTKLLGDMSLLYRKIEEATTVSGRLQLKIIKPGRHYLLSTTDGSEVGQINDQMEERLNKIFDFPELQLIAYVSLGPLRHRLQRVRMARDATVSVDIYINGLKQYADSLGRILSRAKLYLQDPEPTLGDIEYHNPHLLIYADCPIPVDDTSDNIESGLLSSDEQRLQLDQTISELYSSVRRNRDLERMTKSSMVITALEPHQEEALQFMYQREYGPVSEAFTLWQYVPGQGQAQYKHIFTGLESSDRPSELGGGILADVMGMGKTLSALALITKTLDLAKAWSRETPPVDYSLSGRVHRVKATLVVVPNALIYNGWLDEIRKHLDGSLVTSKYHGRGRDSKASTLIDSDIVFTTYHTLAASEQSQDSLIHGFEWFRIVLDEAHLIRRDATALHQAAWKINARFRWCLTGTPIQNALEDFGALLAFLRFEPFQSLAMFRRHIVKPIDERRGAARDRAIRQFAQLMDCVSIRRTQDLLSLPKTIEQRSFVDLSTAEKLQYKETASAMERLIKEAVLKSGNNRNLFNLFQAQLQLRILCNHGTFQKKCSNSNGDDRRLAREDAILSLGKGAETLCSSCGNPTPLIGTDCFTSKYRSSDRPVLCAVCVSNEVNLEEFSSGQTSSAPSGPFKRLKTGRSLMQRLCDTSKGDYFESNGYSAKIEKLCQDLLGLPATDKGIVFSEWTRSLDLIAKHLDRESIKYERIDGTCSMQQRQDSLERFSSAPDVHVLLMSTGVGALGLNLTAASHIFILEPQWNPSIEQQAIGRASRIGQQKTVYVTRYLVNDSIEMVMHSQQARKRQLASIGKDSDTLDDIEHFELGG